MFVPWVLMNIVFFEFTGSLGINECSISMLHDSLITSLLEGMVMNNVTERVGA